jgi:hypothetical protein
METAWKAGTPGSIQSGIAIANTSGAPVNITLELASFDGSTSGVPPVSIELPASGQTAKFIGELFTGLPDNFRGFVQISSTSNVAVVGLRLRYNERGDPLLTTMPPVDAAAVAPTNVELYFPHYADSGGYTTQFILFGATRVQSSSGTLQLFPQ